MIPWFYDECALLEMDLNAGWNTGQGTSSFTFSPVFKMTSLTNEKAGLFPPGCWEGVGTLSAITSAQGLWDSCRAEAQATTKHPACVRSTALLSLSILAQEGQKKKKNQNGSCLSNKKNSPVWKTYWEKFVVSALASSMWSLSWP